MALSVALDLGPSVDWEGIAHVITAASARPEGMLALIIVILAILALIFFRHAAIKIRVWIFVSFFLAALLYTGAIYGVIVPKEKPFVLRGLVVNNKNAGIPDVVVHNLGSESSQPQTTDKEGYFSFTETRIHPGTVGHLRLTKDGYEPKNWEDTIPEGIILVPLVENSFQPPKPDINVSKPKRVVNGPIERALANMSNFWVYQYHTKDKACRGVFKEETKTSWIEESMDADGCEPKKNFFEISHVDNRYLILWDKDRGWAVRLPIYGMGLVETSRSVEGGFKPGFRLFPNHFEYGYQYYSATCKGVFERTSQSNWAEKSQSSGGCLPKANSFEEISADDQFIILWDESRNQAVRLPSFGKGQVDGSSSPAGPFGPMFQLIQ